MQIILIALAAGLLMVGIQAASATAMQSPSGKMSPPSSHLLSQTQQRIAADFASFTRNAHARPEPWTNADLGG